MTEEDVRILLAILHDLFPQKTVKVLSTLPGEVAEDLCKQSVRMIPQLQQMIRAKKGQAL